MDLHYYGQWLGKGLQKGKGSKAWERNASPARYVNNAMKFHARQTLHDRFKILFEAGASTSAQVQYGATLALVTDVAR